jgi:MoaA/NifB/PqqE/SkfB family radical SAM enzyme
MTTKKNKFLTGFKKFLFFQYLKIYVFFVYLKRFFKREIGFRQFIIFLRRVLLLFNKIKINKVVKTRGVYKIHIYLPAFPTKAFFIALDKFLVQDTSDSEINPTSVLLSMSKLCNYHCPHCYQKFDSNEEMPLEKLLGTAQQLQNLNISFINIEGGEPLIDFKRLTALLEILDENRSEIWVNTNGSLVTREKAQKMKDLGVFGVMVSLHYWQKEKYDRFVGVKGAYNRAIASLKIFNKVGISTAINCTGTQDLIKSGGFEKIMQIAKDNNCSLVQLIHEKPAGGWMGRKDTLDKEYLDKLILYHLIYSSNKKFKYYPAISSQAYESLKNNFGCTAGGIERFYINASGEVQPCEFVNVSFGNLTEEPFYEIYKRMRKVFNVPRINWICCTESYKINKAMRQLQQKITPLSKKMSEKLIKDFNLGEETPLYKRMKLYDKKDN